MQTPGEKYLIKYIKKIIGDIDDAKIINVGAGKSTLIEESIFETHKKFECDRIDVFDCRASHPSIRSCYVSSAENMSMIESNHYNLSFGSP